MASPSVSASPSRAGSTPRAAITLDLGDDDDEDDGETEPVELPQTNDPSVLLLSGSGIPIKVISKHGATLYSNLLVTHVPGRGQCIFWRMRPERLGCDMVYLREVTKSFTCASRLVLTFNLAVGGKQDHFELNFELDNRVDEISGRLWTGAEVAELLYDRLEELHQACATQTRGRRSRSIGGGPPGASPNLSPGSDDAGESPSSSSSSSPSAVMAAGGGGGGGVGGGLLATLDDEEYKAIIRTEHCYQLSSVLRWKEAVILLDKAAQNNAHRLLMAGFARWTVFIHATNKVLMDKDCYRWRLHASVNLDTDLQAWYHAVFCNEVYRLRGPFWYRDAVLPQYRHSLDLIDQALTPLEEAALAHVLCSPDTTYGDVAGQMMVVQAVVSPELYSLFQDLSAKGAHVIKCPRQGRPAKKLFRFSFVEGSVYLTWRGKFGNQGVDLGEVSSVVPGITTDILRRHAHSGKDDSYLSLYADARSVDLCYEDGSTRDEWLELLQVLVEKEKGKLRGIKLINDISPDAPRFEWEVLYAALGEAALPSEVKKGFIAAARTSGSGGSGTGRA